MKNLFNDYEKINKLLNGKETNRFTYYYDNKILDNNENKEVLKNILNIESQRNLMISQPGSGKTYSLLKVANELDKITVLAVPNRSQALQIEQDYKDLSIKAVVGGVELKTINIKKVKILAVVFDKLEEVLNKFDISNLIIDEAQELVLATYRSKLENIEDFFKSSVVENLTLYNLIYLTATPNSLMYLDFDNVFEFLQKVKDVFPQSYRMIYYEDNLYKSLLNVLVENINNQKRTLVRLNDIAMMVQIKTDLEYIFSGIKIGYINSREKNYRETDEGIKYFNELTEYVINKSGLPDCNVYFTTCILDKGINLNYIENGNLEELECIYVVKNIEDILIDNIIQFESRIRNKYYRYSIMIKVDESREKREYRDLADLTSREYRKLLRRTEYLNNEITELKNDRYTVKEIKEDVEYQLNYVDINGFNSSMDNSISISDELEINTNLKKFYHYVYINYNKQLYYNPKLIKDFFLKSFEEKYILESQLKDYTTPDNRDEIISILEEVKTNKAILKPSDSKDEETKQENLKKHRTLSNSWELKEMYILEEFGKNENEAIDIVIQNSKKKVSQIENELMLEMIMSMNMTDFRFMEDFLKNEKKYDSIDLKERNNFTYLLKKTSYYDYFKKCIKRGYDLIDMIEDIRVLYYSEKMTLEDFKFLIEYIQNGEISTNLESENNFTYQIQKKKYFNYFKRIIKDLDKNRNIKQKFRIVINTIKKEKSPESFLDIQQYITNNKRYLEDKRTMVGQASLTQRFIIENIGKYENKDKRFLDDDIIKGITDKLNNNFKDEYYKYEDVEKVIHKIFNIGSDNRFNGLRLR